VTERDVYVMLSCELEKNRRDVLSSIEEREELGIFDEDYFYRPSFSKIFPLDSHTT
jgi:hypothetical protein